jgi:hypothetical protein
VPKFALVAPHLPLWQQICLMVPHMPHGAPMPFLVPKFALVAPHLPLWQHICLNGTPHASWCPTCLLVPHMPLCHPICLLAPTFALLAPHLPLWPPICLLAPLIFFRQPKGTSSREVKFVLWREYQRFVK